MSKSSYRVGIIGAGISGLSAAWELAQNGMDVTVFERDKTSGGLAGCFDIGGTTLEKFYHHLYNKDHDLIRLIREVGLEDHLVFAPSVTGCFYVNRIYRLSSPVDLLKYKPLPFIDRLRLGFLALRARMVKDWKTLDDISVRDYIIKVAGKNVYDILWEPLFRSKFGKYSAEVSAAWLWSKLVQRGGSRSKSGAEELGYLKGGYRLLFTQLEKRLAQKGVDILLNTPVKRIIIENGTAKGIETETGTHTFDAVLSTCQLPDFSSLGGDFPAEYKNSIDQIGFLGNVCLVLRLNHALSDVYWVNITDTSCPFVGVIEQTNLLHPKDYQGNHLAYLSRYMDTSDPLYSLDPEALFATYLPYLKKVFPAFREEWVQEKFLWRAPYSQAVVSVGFSRKIPQHRTPVKGLYLSTMAQIFPEDRQMSNGVKLSRKTARMIMDDLKH